MRPMKRSMLHVLVAVCCVQAASPTAAQLRTTIYGRVEDAATRQPIPGIRVTAQDPATSTLTNLDSTFAMGVSTDRPLVSYVEGFGYEFQEFTLPPESVGRISVLRLEPAPLALAGIDVVADQQVEILLGNLVARRRAFAEGASSAFDRLWLERFGPFGTSVLAFVRQRNPWIRVCPANPSALCVPSRIRTIAPASDGASTR